MRKGARPDWSPFIIRDRHISIHTSGWLEGFHEPHMHVLGGVGGSQTWVVASQWRGHIQTPINTYGNFETSMCFRNVEAAASGEKPYMGRTCKNSTQQGRTLNLGGAVKQPCSQLVSPYCCPDSSQWDSNPPWREPLEPFFVQLYFQTTVFSIRWGVYGAASKNGLF